MSWLASKKQKPADPLAAIKAELQRITANLVEEMRGQYGLVNATVDTAIASLENIHDVLLSATRRISAVEARVGDLEARIQKLEQAQHQG
ncbi:MAG: hypothetical protein NDI91_17300 [Sulfuritalea sp.]|nr:hypothetical protein [Sulfuritalea sp.]